MTDIRIGDRFKPEAEVLDVHPDEVLLQFGGTVGGMPERLWVSIPTLLASERIERPIAEGDQVHFCTSTDVLTVRRIVDNYAWVAAAPHDVGAVCPVDNLRRALGVSMEGGE